MTMSMQNLLLKRCRNSLRFSSSLTRPRTHGTTGTLHYPFRTTQLPSNTIIKFVPQQEAWIIERFGRFNRILTPGLNILMPVIDEIKYVKSLKEIALEIPKQSAITEDNVMLELDGVLYFKIVDAYKASYGIEDHEFAITQLAQTTMRAEIGRLSLDRTLAERQKLNLNIVEAINAASNSWGILCLRYEIRDIYLPDGVVEAMHSQVSAERRKRADILASEGQRQAAINAAEGQKQATILEASGKAEALLLQARSQAASLEVISKVMQQNNKSSEAISMMVAQRYLEAFGELAKEGTTVLMDSNVGDASKMISQALAVYGSVNKAQGNKSLPMNSVGGDVKFPLQ
ncbi:hypothetical protein MP638_003599 [Amoeboaphelidium occidentale]|nr:hypothetical protein MP638_003599 [Amoeboaphelidium occidentale]